MNPGKQSAVTPNHRHEVRDAKPRPIIAFGLALVALVTVTMAAMAWMFDYFTVRETRLDSTASPLSDTRQAPSEPRLQVTPSQDIGCLRAEEDDRLSSFGWVDREDGMVHIPIERSMEILAERGLPLQGTTDKAE